MKRLVALLTFTLALTASGLASAHHSGAMFDRTRTVTIKGTLKEVQWINPHAWIEVMADPVGAAPPVQWSFELGGGAGSLRTMGMTRTNPAVGDRITIEGYPLRDKRPGASLIRMTTADGRVFGERLPPSALVPPASTAPAPAPQR
jgi:hypothetical protein